MGLCRIRTAVAWFCANGISIVPGGWSIGCEWIFYILFGIIVARTVSVQGMLVVFLTSMQFGYLISHISYLLGSQRCCSGRGFLNLSGRAGFTIVRSCDFLRLLWACGFVHWCVTENVHSGSGSCAGRPRSGLPATCIARCH